ncbi:Panacea domain-containing protein [Lactiplantibacillus songbeiensis]|uniref:Panacea domain-containing protein n=1 Tax=Lactiplantibacillus songbeiensis TaxID=2559920 RepID=A0ABW4C364_9LACO|nr:type II toxin-antitoxin system antitoxin SocA domain-containing protein [Lactiplantibacillus songbeiensis]
MQNKISLYTVTEIADWYLAQTAMSPRKLQQLMYYTQAWSNALRHRPLIDTEFEAWASGPVSPVFFDQFGNDDRPLTQLVTLNPVIEDLQIQHLLNAVWQEYRGETGNSLEIMARQELPWRIARVGVTAESDDGQVITNAAMTDYYRRIYSGEAWD